MPSDKTHFPVAVSVVVTAEFHNPSILNPDFLASRKIVPENWEVKETMTSPVLSFTAYENGIRWTVDQSKLMIEEPCGPNTKSPPRCHSLAQGYLRALPHIPYRELGLNNVFCKKVADPEAWLTKRFLRPAAWTKGSFNNLKSAPRISFDIEDAKCMVALEVGEIEVSSGEIESSVVARANLHHPGPLTTESICDSIELWPRRKPLLEAALAKILGDSD